MPTKRFNKVNNVTELFAFILRLEIRWWFFFKNVFFLIFLCLNMPPCRWHTIRWHASLKNAIRIKAPNVIRKARLMIQTVLTATFNDIYDLLILFAFCSLNSRHLKRFFFKKRWTWRSFFLLRGGSGESKKQWDPWENNAPYRELGEPWNAPSFE